MNSQQLKTKYDDFCKQATLQYGDCSLAPTHVKDLADELFAAYQKQKAVERQ